MPIAASPGAAPCGGGEGRASAPRCGRREAAASRLEAAASRRGGSLTRGDEGESDPRRWQLEWTCEPGSYVLTARATDADGRQPTGQVWNRGGFANNAAQEIPVTCLAGP